MGSDVSYVHPLGAIQWKLTTWSPLVEGDEQPYQPHGKSSLEMMHLQLMQTFFNFLDRVAFWWGQYDCSSPGTKTLHAYNE